MPQRLAKFTRFFDFLCSSLVAVVRPVISFLTVVVAGIAVSFMLGGLSSIILLTLSF